MENNDKVINLKAKEEWEDLSSQTKKKRLGKNKKEFKKSNKDKVKLK